MAAFWFIVGVAVGSGLTACYYVRRIRIIVETARASSEKP